MISASRGVTGVTDVTDVIVSKEQHQFAATFLIGLTLLNLIAISGVVSRQSSSNVIGIDRDAFSCSLSFFVKASSLFNCSLILIEFTII